MRQNSRHKTNKRHAKQSRHPLTRQEKHSAVRWYCLLLLVCALPHLAGFLLMQYAGSQLTLYFIILYAVIPMTAAGMPFLAAYHHAEPLLTFFPVGLMLLFSPAYTANGLAVFLFVLSLVASVAGQEARKRRADHKGETK